MVLNLGEPGFPAFAANALADFDLRTWIFQCFVNLSKKMFMACANAAMRQHGDLRNVGCDDRHARRQIFAAFQRIGVER